MDIFDCLDLIEPTFDVEKDDIEIVNHRYSRAEMCDIIYLTMI
jgi:hypothetical protein